MILLPSCFCCDSYPPVPPDPCEFPDMCLYKLEILSPVSWGPRPLLPCEDDLAPSMTWDLSYPPCEDAATCCGSATGSASNGRVSAIISRGAARVVYISELGAEAEIRVSLLGGYINGSPYLYADVFYLMVVGQVGDQSRTIRRDGRFNLASDCVSRVGLVCDDPDEGGSILTIRTPVEFTVNAASPGAGSWSSVTDTPEGDQSRITACVAHLNDNFEATFRITRRRSCRPQVCVDLSESYPEDDSITTDVCCGRFTSEPVTLTVPPEYDVPCQIRITGYVDDDLLIDGDVIEEGLYPALTDAQYQCVQPVLCNKGHAIGGGPGYVMSVGRTFTVAVRNNLYGGSGYNLRICYIDEPGNPLP